MKKMKEWSLKKWGVFPALHTNSTTGHFYSQHYKTTTFKWIYKFCNDFWNQLSVVIAWRENICNLIGWYGVHIGWVHISHISRSAIRNHKIKVLDSETIKQKHMLCLMTSNGINHSYKNVHFWLYFPVLLTICHAINQLSHGGIVQYVIYFSRKITR